MQQRAKRRFVSSSIQIILEQLERLGLTKADLAKRLDVSPDYVYRVLNGRVAFPRSRETLESMARVCELDPFVFGEYRTADEALSASARLVWQRMRERDLDREALYQAMSGRISRPYFYSILRGDQPFPANRAYIQLFALALDLPPSAFREFGLPARPRVAPEELRQREEAIFELFFDMMMVSHGYVQRSHGFELLDEGKILAFFLSKSELAPRLHAVLARMGELDMGYRELVKIGGVGEDRLRRLFTRAWSDDAEVDMTALEQALNLERPVTVTLLERPAHAHARVASF